jgi:hypothetical protein
MTPSYNPPRAGGPFPGVAFHLPVASIEKPLL